MALDYDTLRLFSHLAGTLHFGRTSRECHISPSALSRAIQRLEQDVGRPLFERDQRKVSLTPDGKAFLTHTQETLQRWDVFKTRLSGQSGLSGEIAIFASVTACQSFLPALLAAFRAAHPDIHIRLETGYATDALDMLSRGVVDVAVAAMPDKVPRSLVSHIVEVTPLRFFAPTAPCEVNNMASRAHIAWGEIPLILPAVGLARASVDRWLRRRHITPKIYSEVPGNEALLSLVSLGCGVGIVPQLVADKSPLRALVRPVEGSPELEPFRIGVCTSRTKLRLPIVSAFWQTLAA